MLLDAPVQRTGGENGEHGGLAAMHIRTYRGMCLQFVLGSILQDAVAQDDHQHACGVLRHLVNRKSRAL